MHTNKPTTRRKRVTILKPNSEDADAEKFWSKIDENNESIYTISNSIIDKYSFEEESQEFKKDISISKLDFEFKNANSVIVDDDNFISTDKEVDLIDKEMDLIDNKEVKKDNKDVKRDNKKVKKDNKKVKRDNKKIKKVKKVKKDNKKVKKEENIISQIENEIARENEYVHIPKQESILRIKDIENTNAKSIAIDYKETAIENLSSVYRNSSVFLNALFTDNGFDVGMIRMKRNEHFENYNIQKNYIFYIISGSVEITLRNSTFLLKRDSIFNGEDSFNISIMCIKDVQILLVVNKVS